MKGHWWILLMHSPAKRKKSHSFVESIRVCWHTEYIPLGSLPSVFPLATMLFFDFLCVIIFPCPLSISLHYSETFTALLHPVNIISPLANTTCYISSHFLPFLGLYFAFSLLSIVYCCQSTFSRLYSSPPSSLLLEPLSSHPSLNPI